MIVATAGHIDHGKTTLVRALTGVDTDRLPEEKARGISIEVGFAYYTLGDGRTIAFVDVPGHERFIRNMLSGVYAVSHVLLVVAADDGVMPQTREHLHIVTLLGVSQGTVAITKKDRVDAARLAQVEHEVRELLRSCAFPDVPVIAVSALTGDGIDALRDRLTSIAVTQQEASYEAGKLARYVVDRVFSSAGSGTVVTGTVISGAIGTGEMLVITPTGTHARVRKMQHNGQATDRASAGERCAINLANVKQSDVARGDWLVDAAAHCPTDRIDVQVKVVASERGPLHHWTPIHVHLGAADVPSRLTLRRGAFITPGEQGFAQLRLQRPVHAAHGDRFILRDQSATRTIGGGVVIDPFPVNRRRAGRAAVLVALAAQDPRESIRLLLDGSSDGVRLEWLARIYNVSLDMVLTLVPSGAVVISARAHIAFSVPQVASFERRVLERVRQFHVEQRELACMELVPLHREIAPAMSLEAFAALVRQVAPHAGLRVQGSQVRLVGHDSTDNPRDVLLWQRVRPRLLDAGAAIPSVRELSTQILTPLQQLRDLMHRKSDNGDLVRLTPERFALPETMEILRQKAEQTAQSCPDGVFTAAQYRDVIGTGRSLAIEILESLDRQGATCRRGDKRTMKHNS